ncbi:MAG: hypothetical protein RLZZ507_3549 [Cyanobacteriota bacterium]|jgi:hypothetical protein
MSIGLIAKICYACVSLTSNCETQDQEFAKGKSRLRFWDMLKLYDRDWLKEVE